MKLSIDVWRHLLELLEIAYPYSFSVVNKTGIVIADTDKKNIGKVCPEIITESKTFSLPERDWRIKDSVLYIFLNGKFEFAIKLSGDVKDSEKVLENTLSITKVFLEALDIDCVSEKKLVTEQEILTTLAGVHPVDKAELVNELSAIGFSLDKVHFTLFIQLEKMNTIHIDVGERSFPKLKIPHQSHADFCSTDTAGGLDNKKRRYAPRGGVAYRLFLWGFPKGATPPFGTRLCEAKCSVLYALPALP